MIFLAFILLLILVALFTGIQTFYLEGMRLRTRDLPSLQYFKAEIEPRLNLRQDEGALTFALWKHSCLLFSGIAVLADVIDGGALTASVAIEGIAAAWITMIVFAYLIPQLLFRGTNGHWLRPVLPFYRASAVLIRPLVALLNFLQSLVDATKEESAHDEPAATAAENIDTLIAAGEEEGLIEKDDRKLIQSVVAFGDKVVREVMTPRPDMVTIQADRTLESLHELVVNEQYSRIPVYQTSIDDIVGFVHVRDMFEVGENSRLSRNVRELMRPVRLIPETKPVNDLMREMQQEGAHMVIVVDEYGATAGLVTMEDLVEVILGEIRDEHEPGTDLENDGHGGYLVAGNFDVARIGDVLPFRPEQEIESTTIGGLVTEWLGRVPATGESIERDGIRVEVLAGDEMRVEKVRLSAVPVPQPASSPNA